MDPSSSSSSSSSSSAAAAASSSSFLSSSILVGGAQKSSQSSSQQESSPIERLPEDSLQHIFSHLPLPQVVASRSVSRLFYSALSSPPFLSLLPPLPLLVLRHPRHSPPNPPSLLAFDPSLNSWHRFPLSFVPFPSLSPITASPSLLYLWSDTTTAENNTKTLVPCNPLTRTFRPLPPLGSAWSRHGTVLAGPSGCVLVLTELAALFYPPASRRWLKFSLNLPSKPRSPVLVGDSAYAICDVGSPWRSQWKLFACRLADLGLPRGWDRLERPEWGDIFDLLKRPRLLRGRGEGEILMVGGLRSSYVPDAPCSTVMILRLHLGRLEWDNVSKMPVDMYKCFGGPGLPPPPPQQQHQQVGNNKVKVFGGDGRIWFSGKKVKGKMVMWEDREGEATDKGGDWRWIEGAPGYGDGAYRGFVFSASLTTTP